MATERGWTNGAVGLVVFTAIRFQSRTASAFATACPNSRVAINMHTPKVLFVAPPFILFIVFPPIFTAFGQHDRHSSVRRRLGRIIGRVESDSSRDFKASFSACAVFLSVPVKVALVELREKVT